MRWKRLLLLPLLAGPALAGDLAAFNAAVEQAYEPYRTAMSYLRAGADQPALVELERMAQAWGELKRRFAADPPPAFAADPDFAPVLAEVEARAGEGLWLAERGDLAGAQAALQPVRDRLAELRRRNGVRVFGDCVEEVTRAMDTLWRLQASPPDLADAAATKEARDRLDALDAAMRGCDREAGEARRADPQFRRLIDGALASLAGGRRAVETGDAALFVNVLRELRAIERILFQQFG